MTEKYSEEFLPVKLTPAEHLTLGFYRWEHRGRGWQVWEYPVELEPAFEPFHYHFFQAQGFVDDGRHPTLLSSMWDGVKSLFKGLEEQEVADSLPSGEELPLLPAPFEDYSPIFEITLSLPAIHNLDIESIETFLINLSYSYCPISFEIIGTSDSIFIQFTCRYQDRYQLKQQLKAFFPEAVLYEELNVLLSLWGDGTAPYVVDFGLSQEFMRPLRTFRKLEPDPLTGIFGAMDDLQKNEVAVFQVLFQAANHPWSESIIRAVTDHQGKSFFADSPEMVQLSKEKIQRPLFGAVIRAAANCSSGLGRSSELVEIMAGSLRQVANPLSNELLPLTNDDYDDDRHEKDLLLRQTHRSAMLLNSAELVGLVHPPSGSVRSAKLRRELKKSKAAPDAAYGHKLILGENQHQGQAIPVSLSYGQRLKHMHIVGATGTGKSTLLLNMIIQDIENGQGMAVLDPHGDLIERIMGYIPEERLEDVVLLDPSDSEYPVGLNILSAYSEIDKTVLASDLVSVFRRLSTSWGDQMNSIFSNAVLAFLESDRGGTLLDLRRFLVEKRYREEFLQTVRDKEVLYYWQKEFPLLSGKVQSPILTRLDTFLRPKPIRNMVRQKEGLNFKDLLDGKKIVLAKLAQGLIGVDNAYLLGTIIVSKLHQAAMSRQAESESERRDFFLYVDEFQNFITRSMAEILSGGRKYHFGLVLAHQDLKQLMSRDPELASSVISNPGVRICFRLGDFDARKLEDGFAYFDARDLQNLGIGDAICRVERMENDFNLKTSAPAEVEHDLVLNRQDAIIKHCRKKYAVPLSELETETEEAGIAYRPTQRELEEPEEVTPSPSIPLRMRRRPEPEEQELAGKGGREHKYLQHFVQKAAENMGYRAIIEHPVPDGSGSIDVYLERPGMRLACEISVTTSELQELSNIRKSLASGIDKVLILSQDKTLSKLRDIVLEAIGKSDQEKILFFQTKESLVGFLKEQAASAESKEEWIKGYKVKVQESHVSEEKGRDILKTMSQVFVSSYKREKGVKSK